MELFIKLENGQPVGHPIFANNLRQAYPNIDPSDPVHGFAKFVRIKREDVGQYKVVLSGPTYAWVGDTVQDIWETRDMTAEERAEYDQSME
jgi:hypothetical protein